MKPGRIRVTGKAMLGCCVLFVCIVVGWFFYMHSASRGLPYRSSFATSGADAWTAYGGAWQVSDGSVRNDSDERGAKLVTGSTYWRDYTLQADVRLLSEGGDVGVIVRSRDEEAGVDAYNGYYVGLRSDDNSLIMGRAGFGWIEVQPVPSPGPVRPLSWYHFKVVAVGCRLAASATSLATGKTAYIAMEEPSCVRSGRIGLRSLATGGEWKNVSVTVADTDDLAAIARHAPGFEPLTFPSEAAFNRTHAFVTPFVHAAHPGVSPMRSHVDVTPIGSLQSRMPPAPAEVTVRGVVTLLHPELYVQDASGGVAVSPRPSQQPSLSLGDEVQVQGQVRAAAYATSLSNASLRLLWDRTPASPMAVTAWQASSGNFAGVLVETQGEVVGQHRSGNALALDLTSGDQSFRVLMDRPFNGSHTLPIARHSLIRVRGVCVLSSKYTQGLFPFVLLLRSTDDVRLIAGPPWWSGRNLAVGSAVMLLLLLLLQAYHGAMERRRQSAIGQERERLAHDLHDTLAQSFAGVAFQLHGIRNRLRLREHAQFETIEQQLEVAASFVRRTHQEASLSIAMLRSHTPEVSDLLKALQRSVDDLTAPGVAQVFVVGDSTGYEVPLRTTDAFFHIGREALVNAVRHAQAATIRITLTYDRACLSLEVQDDGVGFLRDPRCQRLGIVGMERRAASIHARLCIDTVPGEGTRVLVVSPIVRHVWPFSAWVDFRRRA